MGRLVSLRWFNALLMLVIGLGAAPAFGIELPTVALLVIALALAGWNLFTHRHPPPPTPGATLMELLVDVAAWASFLYLTGGATNPMASLLLPLVAVGATLLPMPQAWLLAAITISTYVTLWFAHRPIYLPDPEQAALWHLAGMEATFAVSAGVVVWYVSRLAHTIRQRDRTLAHARERALRNERILALANQAAGAAHELGTPLASMRLLVTELIPRTTDPETREDLCLIDQQIEECKKILSRLTEAAGRARAGDSIAGHALPWLKGQIQALEAQNPGAHVILRESEHGASITTDASLSHAVHNLLTNAVKASPDATAEIELQRRDNLLDIHILDRGPGMPQGLRSRVDDPTRAQLPSEGLGIGLLLTQAAIEAHGGSLTYQERPGGGTIAVMTLPIVQP